jgi:hypothetical protein
MYLDAVDIGSTNYLRPYNENPKQIIRSTVESMTIGDIIPCRYTAATANTAGYFSDLGTCVATEIPISGTATPDGLFYFIKSDKGLLIADRVVQTGISWDALNANCFIEGNPIKYDIQNKALYHFGLGSANILKNEITGSTGGNFYGPPVLVPGVRYNGLSFNGSSQSINCGSKIIPMGAKSIRFKIKVTSIPSISRYFFANINNGNTQYGLVGTISPTGTVGVFLARAQMNSYNFGVASPSSICDNIWHDVLFTWDGTTTTNAVKLYLDGMLVNTSTASQVEIISPSYNLYIGSLYNYLATSFIGCLDEFEVYDHVIQPTTFLDCKIRSLAGGNSYRDTDGKFSLTDKGLGAWPVNNEWDKYVVYGELGGKIIPGDNNVWHWNNGVSTFCKDTAISGILNSAHRTCRSPFNYQNVWHGQNNSKHLDFGLSSGYGAVWGFRPVLEYPEDARCTNIWY